LVQEKKTIKQKKEKPPTLHRVWRKQPTQQRQNMEYEATTQPSGAVPRVGEMEQQRLMAFAKLENELTLQIKGVNEQAKVLPLPQSAPPAPPTIPLPLLQKLKESPLRDDKKKAVEYYRRQKEMMGDLKLVVAAREAGQPLPRSGCSSSSPPPARPAWGLWWTQA